jgi:hypothetical protein
MLKKTSVEFGTYHSK